jgi:LPS sulfotransferase NodH
MLKRYKFPLRSTETSEPIQQRADATSVPRATQRILILFTPRTGSSRLAHLMKTSGTLGDPGEVFNPLFVTRVADRYSVNQFSDYIDALLRYRVSNSVFSCKATYSHIVGFFGSSKSFFKEIKPTHIIWLYRRDIVAQAISLARLNQTGVAHSIDKNTKAVIEAGEEFKYQRLTILKCLLSIVTMEIRSVVMLKWHKVMPLSMTYEECTECDPSVILARIHDHVGTTQTESLPFSDIHEKLAGEQARSYQRKFEHQHKLLVCTVARMRNLYLN